jgi:hypothetical protein
MPGITATQEVEIRRITIQGSTGKKLARTTPPHPVSTNNRGMVFCTCNPSYAGELGRRIMVQGQPEQNCETLYKK